MSPRTETGSTCTVAVSRTVGSTPVALAVNVSAVPGSSSAMSSTPVILAVPPNRLRTDTI